MCIYMLQPLRQTLGFYNFVSSIVPLFLVLSLHVCLAMGFLSKVSELGEWHRSSKKLKKNKQLKVSAAIFPLLRIFFYFIVCKDDG